MKSNKSILTTLVFVIIILFIALPVAMLPFTDLFRIDHSFKSFYDDELYTISLKIIEELESGQTDLTRELLEKQLENPEQGVSQIGNYFHNNSLNKFYLIGATKNILRKDGSSEITQGFDFQLENKNSFGILSMTLIKDNNNLSMTHLMLQPMEETLIEHNRFYKSHFGWERILLMALFILSAGFVVFTLFDYIKHTQKPQILHLLLLSLSVVLFSINWNTLSLDLQFFSIGLNPAQIFRPGYAGVWQMNFYIPVFSILYWTSLRKTLFRSTETGNQAEDASESGTISKN